MPTIIKTLKMKVELAYKKRDKAFLQNKNLFVYINKSKINIKVYVLTITNSVI